MRWTVKRSRPRHEPWGLKKLKDSAIQTRIYENWVSRYFVISLNFTPPLRLFTVLFAYVAFLGGCFVIMGLRRSGWRQNWQIRALSSRSPHRLHLTFVAFCILSVIRKQYVKKYNYYVDQSELLARFRTDFTSSVWNFFCWGADVPPGEMSLTARSEEKWLYS